MVLGAGAPPPGGFNLPGGSRPTPVAEAAEEEQEVSRFESATERAGLQSPDELDLDNMLAQAGVDTSAPEVQAFIRTIPDDLPVEVLRFYMAQLAQNYPSVPVTDYALALDESGFEAAIPLAPAARGLAAYGMTPEDVRRLAGRNFEVQPDTGWIQYANGVLVDPTVPIGSAGGVYFDPGSDAAGSPAWLQKVQSSWSPEKVAEWRKRLFDYGFLSQEQAKVKGVDAMLLTALSSYHIIRYQNFGKPIATDLATAGGAGADKFNLTARDFQQQIQNDVREQYRRVFGDDPSDAELREWSQFVTNSAMKAQRRFERKGATPSSALSLAATEAEERLVAGFETSPEAEIIAEANSDESTRLRDAFAQAARVSAALGG